MELFTESPLEAALWTYCVSLQEKLSDAFFNTALFRSLVGVFLAAIVLKALVRFANGEKPWLDLGVKLLMSFLGLTFLTSKSSTFFYPTSSNGSSWASRAGDSYVTLKEETYGLRFYRMVSDEAVGLSGLLSKTVAEIFGDGGSQEAPLFLFRALNETARQTIDDPEVLATADKLFEVCAREKDAVATLVYASMSSQFDLSTDTCQRLHSQFQDQLQGWASSRMSSRRSYFDKVLEAARNNVVTRTLGIDDNQALKNKMIASALADHLQDRAGLSNLNVSRDALLNGGDRESLVGTSTWVSLSKILSVGGFLNLTVRPFTGTDYEAADTRNDMAALYSKVMIFLPALRGFAKGIVALMFLIAAARMCFGSMSLMISWGWCLLLVTAYDPLSQLLYQATVTLTKTPESIEAMAALKNDPLVLVGAQVIDTYASKIQATYFVLQLGLALLTATAGLAIFRYQRALGGALSGSLIFKSTQVSKFLPGAKPASGSAPSRSQS